MPVNNVYKLAGNGTSVTYETGSESVELVLDNSYSPFDGTFQVSGGDLTKQPAENGLQLAGILHYESVGRGGPIQRKSRFMLFLPDSPEPTDSAVEMDATGAVVLADPDPRGEVAPKYRAESLTGTLSVPAAEPSGRF